MPDGVQAGIAADFLPSHRVSADTWGCSCEAIAWRASWSADLIWEHCAVEAGASGSRPVWRSSAFCFLFAHVKFVPWKVQ